MANEEALQVQASIPVARSGEPDEALRKFRCVLEDLYGEDLKRVVLFGSRARGDARPDSDYDVAVFLGTLPDWRAEADRLSALRVDFFDAFGVFIEAIPFRTDALSERTPIMHEIRKDGVEI